MTAPRDLIVPGSARLVTIHEEYTVVRVRCGKCGREREARAESKTARCACGRTIRLQAAVPALNVTPLRRTA